MGGQCPGIILKILVNAQVSGGDVVPRNERLLEVNDFIKTNVRVEVSLDVVEKHDRTVSAAHISAVSERSSE